MESTMERQLLVRYEEKPQEQGIQAGQRWRQKKEETKEAMPGYDSALWSTSLSASSSTTPEPSVSELTRVLKSIVETGQLKVPPEAAHLLASQEKLELKEEMQKEQRSLNAKRKAHNKVIRLKETLEGKKQKFQAYKMALKEQLAKETERFEQDMQSLKDAITEAEANLAKIERGEHMEKDIQDVELLEIEELLGTEEGKEKAQLQAMLINSQKGQQEAEEKYTALHQQMVTMQHQYQLLAQSLHTPLSSGHARITPSPVPSQDLAHSPQLPKPAAMAVLGGPNQDGRPSIGPFTRTISPKTREGPYTEKKPPCRTEAEKDDNLTHME